MKFSVISFQLSVRNKEKIIQDFPLMFSSFFWPQLLFLIFIFLNLELKTKD
jgi:hypothetical protein